jgi:hypothetical protein
MEGALPRRRASRLGPIIVLIGAAGFLVSCFLPYYGISPISGRQLTVSLYRLCRNPRDNS